MIAFIVFAILVAIGVMFFLGVAAVGFIRKDDPEWYMGIAVALVIGVFGGLGLAGGWQVILYDQAKSEALRENYPEIEITHIGPNSDNLEFVYDGNICTAHWYEVPGFDLDFGIAADTVACTGTFKDDDTFSPPEG